MTHPEALAATLYICDYVDAAIAILDEFTWGREFVKVNEELLELYRTSDDADDVVRRQNDWLRRVEAEGGRAGAGHLSSRRNEGWKRREDEDEDEDEDESLEAGPPSWRNTGEAGALPPAADDYDGDGYYYEEYDSDNAPKLDRFGNIIEEDPSEEPPSRGNAGEAGAPAANGYRGDESDDAPTLDRSGNVIVEEDPKEGLVKLAIGDA